MSSESRSCANCGKVDTNLLRCSRCQQVYYCGTECQKISWNKEHKGACKKKKTGERMPLFRELPGVGVPYFLGIVRTEDGKHIKLDDPSPSGQLDGAGHVMSEIELATEMNMYRAIEERRSPASDHPLLIKKVCIRDFDDGNGGMNWADYIDPQESTFDIKFPFSVTDYCDDCVAKQVRAGDSVKIGACGELKLPSGGTKHYREAFWAVVISVSSLGFVTAKSKSTLKTGALNEGDMFYFPLTSIIGMYKSENWE